MNGDGGGVDGQGTRLESGGWETGGEKGGETVVGCKINEKINRIK